MKMFCREMFANIMSYYGGKPFRQICVSKLATMVYDCQLTHVHFKNKSMYWYGFRLSLMEKHRTNLPSNNLNFVTLICIKKIVWKTFTQVTKENTAIMYSQKSNFF